MTLNGHNGFFTDTEFVPDRFGNPGKAVRFNGRSSSVFLANADSLRLENFTYSLWSRPSQQYQIHPVLLAIGNTIADQYLAVLEDNRGWTYASWYNYGPGQVASYILPDTTAWTNMIIVRTADRGRLYINCEFVGEVAFTSASPEPYYGTGAAEATIGSRFSADNYFFAGDIDNVRIYDRALGENEIIALCSEASSLEEVTNNANVHFTLASQNLFIASTTNISNVIIADISGKICADQNAASAQVQVDVTDFVPGIYIVSVKQDNNIIRKKIFIE